MIVPSGTFHALVGENGAGKSTLAKCLLGFYRPDGGVVRVGDQTVVTPLDARRSGLGMVFQHFTLAPSLTVAENLVMARHDLPTLIDWKQEKATLARFLEQAPFSVDLESKVYDLAAGQKQKVEILKQLYLQTRILILDEPTSVLTPSEATEVMTVLRGLVEQKLLSIILITHKLREVLSFADDVTVLRRGRQVATSKVAATSGPEITSWIMGDSQVLEQAARSSVTSSSTLLEIKNLTVLGDHGLPVVRGASLSVKSGEIVGIAGVSGNGQRELVQAIGGQRDIASGDILANGQEFHPTRSGIDATGLFTLPEEPLANACVPSMSVADNMALRSFDKGSRVLLHRSKIRSAASELIQQFGIRTPSIDSPIKNLSGGNIQRAVLARDLGANRPRIMVAANPCFGLDMGATAFVHNRLMELRNAGGAILLISEDLDELLKLSDRIAVIHGGAIAYEAPRSELDIGEIGRHMSGMRHSDTP